MKKHPISKVFGFGKMKTLWHDSVNGIVVTEHQGRVYLFDLTDDLCPHGDISPIAEAVGDNRPANTTDAALWAKKKIRDRMTSTAAHVVKIQKELATVRADLAKWTDRGGRLRP